VAERTLSGTGVSTFNLDRREESLLTDRGHSHSVEEESEDVESEVRGGLSEPKGDCRLLTHSRQRLYRSQRITMERIMKGEVRKDDSGLL